MTMDFWTIFYATCIGGLFSMLVAASMCPAPVLEWVRRVRYRYEVTLPLYMLTPTEQAIIRK